MANNNTFSLMALEALKAKTDSRKAKAIELQKSGLDVNQIKTKMGISRRTVKRYLPDAK